jgi:hypothetical protein
VVYRALLDRSGRLDAQFDLPGQSIGQSVNLDIALTYTPDQPCGPLIAPVTFQIDPRSTLTVQRGGPPLGGFSAMPSEFAPSFMVALDGTSPDQLIYAARVVAAISSLTSSKLSPKVVDVKTAADADTGALIVAKSSALKETSLHPPVSGDGADVDIDDMPNDLRANITDGLGSIQVFADRPRDRTVVLVTTTGAWNLVDPLFRYIEGLDGKWTALFGDVLAAGRAGEPINLSVFAEPSAENTQEPQQAESTPIPWALIGAGVAALAVAAVVAGILVSSRRRKRPQPVGSDSDGLTKPSS